MKGNFSSVLELTRGIKHPTFRELPTVGVISLPSEPMRGTSSGAILLSHPTPHPMTIRKSLRGKEALGYLTNTAFMKRSYFLSFSKTKCKTPRESVIKV